MNNGEEQLNGLHDEDANEPQTAEDAEAIEDELEEEDEEDDPLSKRQDLLK